MEEAIKLSEVVCNISKVILALNEAYVDTSESSS